MGVSGWIFGGVGLVLGVAGLIYGEWARKHPAKPVLFSTVEVIPIGVPEDPLIDVTYKQDSLKSPVITTIRLTNKGYVDVDEFSPGSVQYTISPATVGRVKGVIGEGADSATIDRTSGSIDFRPAIIKRGETIEVRLMCDGVPEITEKVRLANVNVTTYQDELNQTLPRGWIALLLVTFAVALSAIAFFLENRLPAWLQATLAGVVPVSMIVGLGAVLWDTMKQGRAWTLASGDARGTRMIEEIESRWSRKRGRQAPE